MVVASIVGGDRREMELMERIGKTEPGRATTPQIADPPRTYSFLSVGEWDLLEIQVDSNLVASACFIDVMKWHR